MIEPRIGVWWTMCCQRDYQRVGTEEELEKLRNWLEEGVVWKGDVYETELDLLLGCKAKWGTGERVRDEVEDCYRRIGEAGAQV